MARTPPATIGHHTVRLKRGHDGRYYLTLVGRNGEPLAHSEGYRTAWNARRAARRNFATATLVDHTRTA